MIGPPHPLLAGTITMNDRSLGPVTVDNPPSARREIITIRDKQRREGGRREDRGGIGVFSGILGRIRNFGGKLPFLGHILAILMGFGG